MRKQLKGETRSASDRQASRGYDVKLTRSGVIGEPLKEGRSSDSRFRRGETFDRNWGVHFSETANRMV